MRLPSKLGTSKRLAQLLMGAVLILLGATSVAHAGDANAVLSWNVRTLSIAAAGGQNGIVQTRTLAMVHAAIHDAVNAIDRRYESVRLERVLCQCWIRGSGRRSRGS